MATRQTPSTRAKDKDRNDTCAVLDSALGDGQLTGEEHRQRVAAATTAATLGELQRLVDDLQTENAPVKLPDLRPPSALRREVEGGSRWIRLAMAAVLVLLGIGIGWGLYGNTTSPLNFTSDPGAKSDGVDPVVLTAPRQLHSLGGLTGLLEQMRQKFGDTMGYRLVVYPDYASLERADPSDERRKFNYYYKGGFDDPSSSTKSDRDRLVDLAKFDAKTVIGLLRGAPETLGMKPTDVSGTYLIVDPSGDPNHPDGLEISVNVSSDFGSGSIDLKPDGTQQINYPS